MHVLVGLQTGAAPMENIMESLQKKLTIDISYDSAIPLLGIYSTKMRALIQKEICTPMFIAALFTIAMIWKQPR